MRKVYELSKLIHTQDKLFSGDGIVFSCVESQDHTNR